MFNKAILIGRLTADPELKQTTAGTYLVNFRIAVDRRFKSQDGERKADFITIVCWRQQAEFVAKYFHKGDPIGVEGSIQTRDYEDRQGNKRTARRPCGLLQRRRQRLRGSGDRQRSPILTIAIINLKRRVSFHGAY